ncbi:MAG TPA: ATP-binding protein [Kofleriaceae bacterium]|nr:ATP-binding protein [Kofleriaceae bacterium]
MAAAFEAAEHVVSRYFAERGDSPERGTIEVHGERYVLVRAAALSVEFFALVRNLYGEARSNEADEFARNILFDLAHAIGKSDARSFHAKMNVSDPIERLSAGPVHFAHTGWAQVEISADSRPSPDDEFYLLYDHPYSFEASAWEAHDERATFPVCVMNAGYSSGWCEESFGVPLVATEILCRARGDASCRFVMANPTRIEEHVAMYREARPELRLGDYQIPDLFARKRMEDELRRSRDDLEERVARRTAELEEATERLVQAQKLEAVGRLAGGIAHDFNNLLGVILMRATMAQSRLAQSDPAWRDLEQIRKASERGGALSRQLLAFSKRQPLERKPLDLGHIVREVQNSLLPLVGEHIQVVTSLGPLAYIEGDQSQIEQVLMNLVFNARDAMARGGVLRLSVDVVDMQSSKLTTGPLAAGRYARLAVGDTGTGMDADTMARAFDPYFTTKADGRGTGLGLSTVYGIVEQAGGGIALESAPGIGTTFTLYFPSSTLAPQPEPAPMVSRRPAKRTPCRILLVEDEVDLRETLTELLAQFHDVVAAESGPAALDILETRAFDILLTDLVMPELDGRELGRRVQARWPDVRVMYMSGYDRERLESLEGSPVSAKPEILLHKPFRLDELLKQIEEVLGELPNDVGRERH